jgi:carbon-monoxide dehydrogenase large subunit
VPVDAYRGAGRPEASYLVERMVDAAAAELGLSQAEFRQRNFIQPDEMPYTTATGLTYDSGDFPKMLGDALERADWNSFAARRAASGQAGKLRGIGVSCYIESCGGYFDETADLRLEADGSATLTIGSQNNGQGQETTFAQLIAGGLNLPMDRIRIIQGDSDKVATGNGTAGSCMLSVAGNALQMTIDRIIEKGKQVASLLLEAAEIDIDYRSGTYFIKGTDREISLAAVAASAHDPRLKEHGLGNGLSDRSLYAPAANTYPNGCHIAEIEIDPETGHVAIPRYTIVDDFGRVLNPMMVLGQIHGGTVQGIGQALTENCHYDPESGQLLSGSLTDYALPRADDIPDFDVSFNEFPCKTNPLGVKGAGEAGAIAAPAAIVNAILDATRSLGIQSIDMPVTPLRLWQVLQEAGR